MAGPQRRQPPGRPIGGEYAPTVHAEAGVSLAPAPPLPEGWPASLPAPDVRLDLDDPDHPVTRIYTGDATLRVASGGREVSYDFTPSEAGFDDIQAAIDWARTEHEKATRPAARLAALETRDAILVDQRAVAAARTLSSWAADRYGPDGRFEIGVDPDDAEAMTIVRAWCDDTHEAHPDDLLDDRNVLVGGWISGRELARMLPVKDSDWFDLAEAVHPGGRFDETTYRIEAGYHADSSKVHYLSGQLHKVREAQALAALDVLTEQAAARFGDGTVLHFGPTEEDHMAPSAVIRPDGSRVSDAELGEWLHDRPDERPQLADTCRHLSTQESVWFDRTEAVEVDEWETVYAVRAGGAR